MVSEKIISIWKRKASEGDVEAVEKLKSVGETGLTRCFSQITTPKDIILTNPEQKLVKSIGQERLEPQNVEIASRKFNITTCNSQELFKPKSKKVKHYPCFIAFKTSQELNDWLRSKGNTSKFINQLLLKEFQQEQSEHDTTTQSHRT